MIDYITRLKYVNFQNLYSLRYSYDDFCGGQQVTCWRSIKYGITSFLEHL